MNRKKNILSLSLCQYKEFPSVQKNFCQYKEISVSTKKFLSVQRNFFYYDVIFYACLYVSTTSKENFLWSSEFTI